MTDRKGKIWFSITIAFAVCLTVCYLGNLATKPWRVIPTLGGDGIKNIFTYLYHSMYGKGYWFAGMNYPYGEHITYTDGQPLLSVLFTSLHNASAETALTVLWVLLSLSYVVCIAYLYKILIHFKVGPAAAMIFAGLICIFSPQTFRISGHYALAYMHVIPMLFYWTIKYNEGSGLRYCIYTFVLVLLMSFLHLYFTAVSLVWILSYSLGYFLFTKETLKYKLKHVAPLCMSIVAVFAIMAVVMKATDPLKDRPAIPFGTLTYTTHRKDIITSTYSPFWKYVKDHRIFDRISEGGEGYTYPGLAILFTLAISVVFGIVARYRKDSSQLIVDKNRFSPVWLFIAFAALLLGMGAPFIWHMEWLLDYMSFLRQFRTLGRFSWIFYYVITIYGVVVIYTWYARLIVQQRALAYMILLFPVALWSFEARGYFAFQKDVSDPSMYNYEMLFSKLGKSWPTFLDEHQHKGSDFQAILLLPFFHVGTEKLWLDGGWEITLGSKAALQLQLPIVDVMMSRSSWGQAKQQVKIAAGPYVDKPILREIKSNKPFLLMHFEDDSLDADQKYLLESADYIGDFSQCHVYACYPDRLAANNKRYADSINKMLPGITSSDTCIGGNNGGWFLDHMDNGHSEERLFGSGATPCIKEDSTYLSAIDIKPVHDSQEYEFSCWFLLSNKDYASPNIFLISLDSAGKAIDTNAMAVKWSVDNHDMWFRGSVYFPMRSNCRKIRCKLENLPNPSYKVMDEMMLRPATALIISKDKQGRVMVNNHLFKTGK